MAEPNASSAGILWLIKVYGFKIIAGVVAGGFMLGLWPAKTFRESFLRFSMAISCSMLFGDAAINTVNHYLPWLIDGNDFIRIGIYALVGGPAYAILGFGFRMLETGSKNPMKILEILRGAKK